MSFHDMFYINYYIHKNTNRPYMQRYSYQHNKNFMLIYIFSFNLYYKSFCKRFFINDNNIITAIRSNCGHYILHCKELGNTFFTSF